MKIENRYDAEVEAVLGVVAAFIKGTTVSWSVIEKAMNRNRYDKGGWAIIKRVRKHLLRDRLIATLPDTRVGLRLLTDTENAQEVPVLRQKKARRQINRGLRETSAVDVSLIPNHVAIGLALVRKRMKEERLAISRANNEIAALTKPTRSAMAAG